ncbi:class I tRNA ligase family protein [Candidatus Kaiserbacteria bacterium]|nr:class I tRNA ligase family protein [Candidatus Kaiserbacteria bacterium]
MHKKFNHEEIEKKWQEKWQKDGLYDVGDRDESKEKEYVLVEWPYPSGNLHIGHWYAFAVPDIYVRAQRMKEKQVVFPMGFDAFGLPAENAAIKHNLDPKEWTESNIEHMKKQLQSMGNAFSWDKTASSTDPEYYKWTQWMFTKFFEEDVAYKGKGTVNWCPSCNTVLANEQVVDDACERCGTKVEKKEMDEWKMRITKYADRLVDDLDTLDWPLHIKELQKNWIGRSKGAKIAFTLSSGDTVEVFTTRPDTLYGATYLVLAPEHPLLETLSIENKDQVLAYQKEAASKDERTRTAEGKEKTGVRLEGVTATNPANGKEIPVYIADYVLGGYGTGSIMAVPGHDARDYAFAQKYDLPIEYVVEPVFTKQDGDDAFREDAEIAERQAISAVVYNPKTEKYLGLKWKKVDWDTLITGGIEEGQTAEEAARQEVLEETGYKNLKLVKQLPSYQGRFWHVPKEVNRVAHFQCFLFELENEEQETVVEDEQKKHEYVWLSKEEMMNFRLPEGHRFLMDGILTEDLFYGGNGDLVNSSEFTGMSSEEAKEKITEKVGGEMTNTYRLRDWSIGRQRYWGVPIPIVYDPDGKAHAIPKEYLPWTLPEDVDFKPTGEPPFAKSEELKQRTEEIFGVGWTPEVETMDTFVDSSWYFLRYIDNKNDEELASKETQKNWMPVDLYFGGSEHTTLHLLYSRFVQKALFDLGVTTVEEPYKMRINRGLVLGPDGNKMSKSKGNVIDPDGEVSRVGSDAVKMYLAFMGPYGETANYPWDLGGIAGTRRFLERVYGLSEHVQETESGEMTRTLHKTIAKVSEDIEAFKFNTAISALMMYVNAAEKEGITEESYKVFLRLLAPFAPHLTEELWKEEYSIHQESFPMADTSLTTEEEVTIGVQINGKVRGEITIAPDADEAAAIALVRENEKLKEYIEKGVKKVIYVPGRILSIILE